MLSNVEAYIAMKIKIINPCILFSICLISFSAGAVDFLGDLSQAIGDVSKSTGDIAKSIKDVSKDTPATPSKALPISTSDVPAEFQGKWVENTSNCIGNPDEVIGFDVSKNDISYGTSWGGKIKSIKSIAIGTSIEVISEDCEDGDCQTVTRNLSLSNSGSALSVTNSLGGAEKYSRCGSATVTNASSQDTATKEVIFSCATKKGKIISLTKFGNTIQYSFGFPNKKPELVIDTLEDDVIYQYGSGRTIAATFDKGALNYTVGYLETNKKIEDHNVFINGVIISNKTSYKTIAQVECVSSETEEYQDKLESYIIKKQ